MNQFELDFKFKEINTINFVTCIQECDDLQTTIILNKSI